MTKSLSTEEIKSRVASFDHWHHIIEFAPGVVTPGRYNPRDILTRLELPEDLHGLRALDIGACDGFFTVELHRRGADVTALDYREKTVSGFSIVEEIYGHEFKHINANVYDLAELDLGKFDIVLFLGVLYHLPDPLRALHLLRGVCRKDLYLETYVEDFGEVAAARYYAGDTLGKDITNFFAPNPLCVSAWMEDAGFKVKGTLAWGNRLIARAEVAASSLKTQLAYGVLTPKPARKAKAAP